jgi:catechol 2,3-dioxygenase-like lactoylglutathione lyase family enzyme
MDQTIRGIHHVTAISGAPQPNIDFYVGFLGLRLVKLTVNFDDPGTYHLYYGNELGQPGTIMTFFPWPDSFQGKAGPGMAAVTAFSIPGDALDYWMLRFADEARSFEAPVERFGQQVLGFGDPDDLRIELVADNSTVPVENGVWSSTVPHEHAITGFHSVTLWIEHPDRTARMLTEIFGYQPAGEEGNRLRFRSPSEDRAQIIDIERPPASVRGRMGKGVVHHVAFRASDAEEQANWRERIAAFGLEVTPAL